MNESELTFATCIALFLLLAYLGMRDLRQIFKDFER